jgi:hypothetical protein
MLGFNRVGVSNNTMATKGFNKAGVNFTGTKGVKGEVESIVKLAAEVRDSGIPSFCLPTLGINEEKEGKKTYTSMWAFFTNKTAEIRRKQLDSNEGMKFVRLMDFLQIKLSKLVRKGIQSPLDAEKTLKQAEEIRANTQKAYLQEKMPKWVLASNAENFLNEAERVGNEAKINWYKEIFK